MPVSYVLLGWPHFKVATVEHPTPSQDSSGGSHLSKGVLSELGGVTAPAPEARTGATAGAAARRGCLLRRNTCCCEGRAMSAGAAAVLSACMIA